MCDLATNWSLIYNAPRNDIPASGVVFNTVGKSDDRKAGDKGQKKNVNFEDGKPDKKIDCWNCGGNHFARDCKKPVRNDGEKKGKVNVTFKDDYDDDYGDGIILTCFENRVPENRVTDIYLNENSDDEEILESEIEIDSLPDLESIPDSLPDLVDEISFAISNYHIGIINPGLSNAFLHTFANYTYLHNNVFMDVSNLFSCDMDRDDKILAMINRDYERKVKYRNIRRVELMSPALNVVNKILDVVRSYENFGVDDIFGIFKSLHCAYQRSTFTRSSREVLRLSQLGFLGSTRWDISTSTQYFEILHMVDDESVDSLACDHIEFSGIAHFGGGGEMSSLQQQLVDP